MAADVAVPAGRRRVLYRGSSGAALSARCWRPLWIASHAPRRRPAPIRAAKVQNPTTADARVDLQGGNGRGLACRGTFAVIALVERRLTGYYALNSVNAILRVLKKQLEFSPRSLNNRSVHIWNQEFKMSLYEFSTLDWLISTLDWKPFLL
jgi:hypothetical protein